MRKHVALAACVALPFATAMVASVITPGYPLVGHTSTLLVALLTGFAALFAISLNMHDDPSSDSGWQVAAGWVLAVSILLTTMLEAVILKPGGIDGRQWMPTMAMAAIAVITLCDRDGDRPDRDMLLRSGALAGMALGGMLGASLAIAAAAGRLSGDDLWTLAITAMFTPLVFGAMVQTQRMRWRGRAWLGAVTLAFVYMVVVTSSGTYTWSPHYSSDAAGRQVFQ